MHRSYSTYNPVASKLLQKRWDSAHYDSHLKAVDGAKSMIDSKPPLTFMHLHLKLKKLQLEEERLATIERDNRILLEKMSNIMRTKGRIDNKNDAQYKSLSRERRERELLRITKENQEILKRIMSKKPEISAKELKKDWDYNTKLMGNISTFPEDWYKKSRDSLYSKSITRKTTNLNKSKSEGENLNKSVKEDENIDKKEKSDEN